MKILAINWRCIKNPEMGGAEIHFQEIFKRIVNKGHDVTLIAHSFNNAPTSEIIDGINIKRFGNRYLFDKQIRYKINSLLDINEFDLIVDDISKVPLFTPNFINKPIVGIIHHLHGKSLYKEIPFPLAYYIILQEKKIPKHYNNTPIFAVSESTKNELTTMGLNPDKIDILYNAIDQSLFNKIEINKSDSPLLVYVGRIKRYKNIDKAINAVEQLRKDYHNIQLVIAGTGDYLQRLKEQVKNQGLEDHVIFSGFISEEEKAKLLGKAWIFLTLAEKEGWGITVIEANAMKTPVIGSDVPGLRDSIRNNITGFLVPKDNPDQLIAKIKLLLDNTEKRKVMSLEAKKWSTIFDWDKSADHFIEKVFNWYPQLINK